MSKPVNDLYVFGEFTLDPVRRLLRRDQETVALPPKAIDTLVALVEGRGEVMEKDELMRQVWGDAIVEEVGLAKNISVLRKALGESLGEHRFIVTVPGRGYRFVADVSLAPARGAAGGDLVVETRSISRIASEETIELTVPAADALAGNQGALPVAPVRHWVRRPRVALGIGIALLALATLGASTYWRYFRPQPALTDRDVVLLADFVNQTGEAIFDDTLEQGLAAQLEQSPFFNLFPEASVRQRLRLIGHPPERGVTKDAAREICRREGLKAFVVGTIAPLGTHYAITLEAIDHNGDVLAREQAEASGREQVLTTLTGVAHGLRQRLGESLNSIAKFQGELTTSSLEALKAHSAAAAMANSGRRRESLPFYEAAIRLAPDFAAAYMGLGLAYSNLGQRALATEAIEQAYAMRDRASEWERLRITQFYYTIVTGEADKLIETLEQQRRTYPRDALPYAGLSAAYARVGQWEKAVAAARDAIRLNPIVGASIHYNLALGLLRLNRFDEAREELERAREELRYDTEPLSRLAFYEAFVRGDTARQEAIAESMSTKPTAYLVSAWQANAAAFVGQRARAQELYRRATDLAGRTDLREFNTSMLGQAALQAGIFGQCSVAAAVAARVLEADYNDQAVRYSGIAMALCGESDRVQVVFDTMSRHDPTDTVGNALWRPVIGAALELHRGDAVAVLAQLTDATSYEGVGELWPAYLRGLAHLRLQQNSEAAVEFRKIRDARGLAPLSALYPLAQLGLARATAAVGETAQARQSYQEFLTLWRDADADLPMLIEAKREAEALTAEPR